jgi:hypothetical protein
MAVPPLYRWHLDRAKPQPQWQVRRAKIGPAIGESRSERGGPLSPEIVQVIVARAVTYGNGVKLTLTDPSLNGDTVHLAGTSAATEPVLTIRDLRRSYNRPGQSFTH